MCWLHGRSLVAGLVTEPPGIFVFAQIRTPGTRYLLNNHQLPHRFPKSPATQQHVTGTKYGVTGSMYQVPSTSYNEPDTRDMVPGTSDVMPGAMYLVLDTGYQVPGTDSRKETDPCPNAQTRSSGL